MSTPGSPVSTPRPPANSTAGTCPSPPHAAVLSYEFTAPSEGETWVGLRKTGDDGTAEFVLDSFEVREV